MNSLNKYENVFLLGFFYFYKWSFIDVLILSTVKVKLIANRINLIIHSEYSRWQWSLPYRVSLLRLFLHSGLSS